MKKVLIISPHFPPVNAADMHRVRQSLPFFKDYGWEPTVLTVNDNYVEMAKDATLLASIPNDITIYNVTAFSTKYTRKLGLGNLGLRAFWQLYLKGSTLLKNEKYDLIYFSTTVFACMPLGRLWKRKFKIPFVIDMQDPWRNDYYLTIPKEHRPPKFWFAHRLNKYLEKFTIPKADGLISVSEGYIQTLQSRYPKVSLTPSKILTFGAHQLDFEIASHLSEDSLEYRLDLHKINIIYAGVVPKNMLFSIEAICVALKDGLNTDAIFKNVCFHFLGTNYATGNRMQSHIKPLIDTYGLEKNVFEHQARLPYFQVLKLIKNSNLAILPGTLDTNYTASKLYPYIMAKVPIIAIFNENSSLVKILQQMNYGEVITFNQDSKLDILAKKVKSAIYHFLKNGQENRGFKYHVFEKYESNFLCKEQVDFFNQIIDNQ